MKKLVLSLFVAAALIAPTFACEGGGSEGEGEGEGTEGEGEGNEGEGEGNEGEGEGEEPAPGTCNDDDDCEADETCQTLQQNAASVCFNTCTAGEACTTNANRSGTCLAITQGGPTFCVELSPNLGPCGNPINATCDSQNGAPALCLTDNSGVGFCARLCNVEDPTTCNTAGIPENANACGCAEGEACTLEPNLGAPTGDGLCSPPSTVGDTCGVDQATLQLGLCTDGQICDGFAPPNALTGTCAAAP